MISVLIIPPKIIKSNLKRCTPSAMRNIRDAADRYALMLLFILKTRFPSSALVSLFIYEYVYQTKKNDKFLI